MTSNRHASWLVDFAANYKQSLNPGQVRTANVVAESGNEGETTTTGEPLPVGKDNGGDKRQKAFTDGLPDVSLSQNPKDEEQNRIQKDANDTAADMDKLIKDRERMLTDEGGDQVKHFFYPHANKNGKVTFAQNDLAKIARSGANDVLDRLEDVLQHAEEFVHGKVPMGQREQVFSSIERALKRSGIRVAFNRVAECDAPSAGFGDFTWNDVASFIQDDYRTVPGDPTTAIGGSPDAMNNGAYPTTSIEKKVTKNPGAYTNSYPSKNRRPAAANSKARRVKANLRRSLAKLNKRLAFDDMNSQMMQENVTAPPLGMENVTAPPLGMENDDMSFDFDIESESEELDTDTLSQIKELAEQLLELVDTSQAEEQVETDLEEDFESDSEDNYDDSETEEDSDSETEREAGRKNRFIRALTRK